MDLLPSDIREMLNNFSKEEWDDLNKKLGYFYFKRYGREPRLEMEDLIQRALADLLEGRRRWPEGLKPVKVIREAMRSNASHILKRMNNHPDQSLEDTSELALLKRQNPRAHLQLCAELRELAGGDPLLGRMVEVLIRDPDSRPRDYRAALRDVSKQDVNKAYRRLNRLIRKLKEQANGKEPRTSDQVEGYRRTRKAVRVSRRGVRHHGQHDDRRDR